MGYGEDLTRPVRTVLIEYRKRAGIIAIRPDVGVKYHWNFLHLQYPFQSCTPAG